MRKLLLLLLVLSGSSSLISSDGCLWGPECEQSWWGSVEFLYWKAFEGGFEYADSFNPLGGDLGSATS